MRNNQNNSVLRRPALTIRPHGAYFLASAVAHAAVFAGLTGPLSSPAPLAPPATHRPLQVHLANAPTRTVSDQRPAIAELPRPSAAPRFAPPRPSRADMPAAMVSEPMRPLPHVPANVAATPTATVAAPVTPADPGPAQSPTPREHIALARPQVPVAVTEASHYPDPDLVASYARSLSAGVARLKRYPAIARMRGWQGTAVVSVSIGPKGELLDARIADSSGFSVLDEQALEMIRDAQPLPAAPASLRGLALVVQLPVSFTLTR